MINESSILKMKNVQYLIVILRIAAAAFIIVFPSKDILEGSNRGGGRGDLTLQSPKIAGWTLSVHFNQILLHFALGTESVSQFAFHFTVQIYILLFFPKGNEKFQNYRNRHRTVCILFRNWTFVLKFKSLLLFTINENSKGNKGYKCFMILWLCIWVLHYEDEPTKNK